MTNNTIAPLRVAIATCRALPGITADDDELVRAFFRRGIDVEGHPWDAHVDWSRFDAVMPRSTWDYHRRLPEFEGWLATVDRGGASLINPLSVLRWNLSKRYLSALESRGIAVVSTVFVESSAPTARSLASISEAVGWTDGIVIKPVVSASATDTWSCQGITSADEQRFRDALQHAARGVMVQPFLPEIVRHGEWSLVFLAGQFSHAVVKRPADGDFRVQEEHGGTAQPTAPSAVLVDDAARVLQAAALCAGVGHADILYARIDGVERDGRLLLMEFEAIEPTLYLATSPTAAESLADAIEVQQRRR